jgi:hypothetical protein
LGAFLGLLLREEPESRQPSLVQRSRATVLELWASPDLLRPPGTQLDSSWTHSSTIMSLGAFLGLLLREEPVSRQPSLVQRSQATVLELWASPDLPSSPLT